MSDKKSGLQRYELHYRGGKIICNLRKSPESEVWIVHGRAELEQDHIYFRRPIHIAEKFTNEDDAKNRLIELAKKWIDDTLTEGR